VATTMRSSMSRAGKFMSCHVIIAPPPCGWCCGQSEIGIDGFVGSNQQKDEFCRIPRSRLLYGSAIPFGGYYGIGKMT
jgi:hypothetical protein